MSGLVGELAETYGTESFDPHVTLLSLFETTEDGRREVERKLSAIAQQTPSFRMDLETTPSTGKSFFQCVYLLCQASGELSALHEAVKASLKETAGVVLKLANPRYMPHLSLLYSGVGEEGKGEARAMAGAKIKSALGDGAEAISVGVDSFDLYETPMGREDNTTKHWRRVSEFALAE